VSALGVPAHAALLSDAELAAAATAAAAAAAARANAHPRGPPTVAHLTWDDWKVAYWNLRDLGRWYASRAPPGALVAARAFALGALVAVFGHIAWTLLHWALLPPPRVASSY